MNEEQTILKMIRHEDVVELSINEMIERDVFRNIGRFAVDI
jgi:hypothetical protein